MKKKHDLATIVIGYMTVISTVKEVLKDGRVELNAVDWKGRHFVGVPL